jgi:tetratricopeptide (TPR) repeat protein
MPRKVSDIRMLSSPSARLSGLLTRPSLRDLCAKLLAFALFCSAPAAAQGTEAVPQSEYEGVLSRALEAHARGEHGTALSFMERAHALEPSARTLRGLGIVTLALGRHLEAIRHLEAALDSNEKALPLDLRKATLDLLEHAFGQVGRYEVRVAPPGDFLVDGKSPELFGADRLVLLPGEHTITARAPERAPYEVVLAAPPPPVVVEKVVYRAALNEAPSAPPPAPMPAFYTRKVRLAGIAAGGALVASGAVLWGLAYARHSDVNDGCSAMEPRGCTPAQAQARFDRQNIGELSLAGGVVAGVGAAVLVTVGALELWQWRKRNDVQLRAGLGSLGLSARF